MNSILLTDSFEAFDTGNGFLIEEKMGSAKKVGVIVTVVGIAFILISYIPLEGLTYDALVSIFKAVFFWGGVVLIPLGIITFILKGYVMKPASTTIDLEKREIALGKKIIPFSEISDITVETNEMMNRKMSFIQFLHNGKKKSLSGGPMLTKDDTNLVEFVEKINSSMGMEQPVKIEEEIDELS
jgi:hypothetical protein